MTNENMENLDASVQEEESVASQNEDTSNSDESPEDEQSSEDERYLNQKKRAEKAEAELKELREKLDKNTPTKSEQSSSTTEDRSADYQGNLSAFEIAKVSKVVKDLDDEDLDTLQQVANGIGTTDLAEAASSELFKAHLSVKKEAQRKEQAKLGAATGSGKARGKESPFKKGLTDDEHRAQWDKAAGY